MVGLAHLYTALAWSRSLLAIMDIRARSISFSDRPSKASWAHQITNATVRPFSMVNRLSNTAALFMALAGGWPTSCTSKVCRECAMAEADSRAARRLIS